MPTKPKSKNTPSVKQTKRKSASPAPKARKATKRPAKAVGASERRSSVTKKSKATTVARKSVTKKQAAKKSSKPSTASTARQSSTKKEPKKRGKTAQADTKQASSAAQSAPSKTPQDNPEIDQPTRSKIDTSALKALTHRPKHTPAVFKLSSKRHTPIVFTLEDVRGVIHSRRNVPASEVASPVNQVQAPPQKVVQPAATPAQREEPAIPVPTPSRIGAASINDILGFNPAEGKKPEDADESRVPKKWVRYYKMLINLRDHVREGLDMHTRETLNRSAKDDTGDLSSYSQHMADSGTDTFDRDFALSLVSSEQEALAEIQAAINRIFNGSYGTCEITGEPISKERLDAVPFTRYSVQGQVEFESKRRRSAQRGGAFVDFSSDEAVAFADEDVDE